MACGGLKPYSVTPDIRFLLAAIVVSLPIILWLNATYVGELSEAPAELSWAFMRWRGARR